jgi:hypothetical protein
MPYGFAHQKAIEINAAGAKPILDNPFVHTILTQNNLICWIFTDE